MRILCLIIDSEPIVAGWRDIYDCHRRLWHRCFDACPWVDGYFLRSDPALGGECALEPRKFIVRGHEAHSTILHKSLRAIDTLLTVEHAYVVRTNVSSLYDFRLLRDRGPAHGVYSGHLVNGSYITGSGMILSSDVARALVGPYPGALSEWDDIAISQILGAKGVRPVHEDMFLFDYSKGLDQIEVGKHCHYRLRNQDHARSGECEAAEAVFEKLYGASSC